MLVEILGHAGAGKTTLARRLAKCLTERGCSAVLIDGRGRMSQRPLQRRLLQVYGLLRRPGITLLGLRLLRSGRALRWRALGTLGGLAYRKGQVERYVGDSRVVLVDEGVLHGTWSLTLLGDEPDSQRLAEFIRALMMTDCVISLRPGREAVLSGLMRKTRHRLRFHGEHAVGQLLDKQETVLDSIESEVRRHGNMVTLKDCGLGSVSDLARQLADMASLRRTGVCSRCKLGL